MPANYFPTYENVARNDARVPGKDKKFPCPNCPAGFSEKGSLTRHLRYECNQEPRFSCPYCDYRSKWTSRIYKHVRTHHEGLKVYCIDVYENETVLISMRRRAVK